MKFKHVLIILNCNNIIVCNGNVLNMLCTCHSCLKPHWLPLQTLTEDKYEVRSSVSESAIWVVNINDPKFSLKVTLSSLAMRDEHTAKDQGIYPSVCPLMRFFKIVLSECMILSDN